MYPVLIWENDLTFKGQIDDYEFFQWNYRYRDFDTFVFQCNRYKTNASNLAKGNFIGFIDDDGNIIAGRIDYLSLMLNEQGKMSEIFECRGRGLDGLTTTRIAKHLTDSGTGYDTQSSDAESNMRAYVNKNMIDCVDTDRNISILELETNQNRGGTFTYNARFQPINEILSELSILSGLGWAVLLDADTPALTFHILVGLDRSEGNGVNSEVKFSTEFDNMKLSFYRDDLIESKTTAYIGGQGEANARNVRQVDAAVAAATDLDRREIFIDARDLSVNAEMDQRGDAKLAELSEESIIEFENSPSGPFTFQEHFTYGDIVTVKIPDIVTLDARIVEVERAFTPEYGSIEKIIVGRKTPDLIKILKLRQENFNPEIWR